MSDHQMSDAGMEEDEYQRPGPEDETQQQAEDDRGPGAIRNIQDFSVGGEGEGSVSQFLESGICYLTRDRTTIGDDYRDARKITGANAMIRVALFASGPKCEAGMRRGVVYSEGIVQDQEKLAEEGMNLEEIAGRFIGPDPPGNYHAAEDEAIHIMEDWASFRHPLPGVIAYADGTNVRVARIVPRSDPIPEYRLAGDAHLTYGEFRSDPWIFENGRLTGVGGVSGRPEEHSFGGSGAFRPIAVANANRLRARATRPRTFVTPQAGSTLQPRYRATPHPRADFDTGISTRIAGISIFDETGPRGRTKLLPCWDSSIKGVSIYAEDEAERPSRPQSKSHASVRRLSCPERTFDTTVWSCGCSNCTHTFTTADPDESQESTRRLSCPERIQHHEESRGKELLDIAKGTTTVASAAAMPDDPAEKCITVEVVEVKADARDIVDMEIFEVKVDARDAVDMERIVSKTDPRRSMRANGATLVAAEALRHELLDDERALLDAAIATEEKNTPPFCDDSEHIDGKFPKYGYFRL